MATTDMQATPKRPVYPILDQTGTIQGVDANTSLVAGCPEVVQVDGIVNTEVVKLQVRVDPNAAWVDHTVHTGDGTNPSFFVVLDSSINFARVLVSTPVGGAVVAYAQH